MNTTSKQNPGSKKSRSQNETSTIEAGGESNFSTDSDFSTEVSAQGAESSVTDNDSQSENTSFRSMISQHLSPDSREMFDDALNKASEYVAAGRKYLEEKPVQAAIIGVAVGIAAVAIFTTRPGRKVVERAAGRYVPSMNNWIGKVFKSAAPMTH